MARPSDGDPPRRPLDFAADPDRRAGLQPIGDFDPQATAAKVHERNFGAVSQELSLALLRV